MQGPLRQAQAVASFGYWLGLYRLFAFPSPTTPADHPKTELHYPSHATRHSHGGSTALRRCAEGCQPAPTQLE